jgi:hypothetical protein
VDVARDISGGAELYLKRGECGLIWCRGVAFRRDGDAVVSVVEVGRHEKGIARCFKFGRRCARMIICFTGRFFRDDALRKIK